MRFSKQKIQGIQWFAATSTSVSDSSPSITRLKDAAIHIREGDRDIQLCNLDAVVVASNGTLEPAGLCSDEVVHQNFALRNEQVVTECLHRFAQSEFLAAIIVFSRIGEYF